MTMHRVTEEEQLQAEQELSLAQAAEDLEAFIAAQQPAFQPIARRWGRELYSFCIDTGGIGGGFLELRDIFRAALETIAGAPSKRPIAAALDQRAARCLQITQGIVERLAQQLAQAQSFSLADIRECQGDISRAALLMQAGPPQTPGGLVLPPH